MEKGSYLGVVGSGQRRVVVVGRVVEHGRGCWVGGGGGGRRRVEGGRELRGRREALKRPMRSVGQGPGLVQGQRGGAGGRGAQGRGRRGMGHHSRPLTHPAAQNSRPTIIYQTRAHFFGGLSLFRGFRGTLWEDRTSEQSCERTEKFVINFIVRFVSSNICVGLLNGVLQLTI